MEVNGFHLSCAHIFQCPPTDNVHISSAKNFGAKRSWISNASSIGWPAFPALRFSCSLRPCPPIVKSLGKDHKIRRLKVVDGDIVLPPSQEINCNVSSIFELDNEAMNMMSVIQFAKSHICLQTMSLIVFNVEKCFTLFFRKTFFSIASTTCTSANCSIFAIPWGG